MWSNSNAQNTKIGCIQMERDALLKFKEGLTDPSAWLSTWFGDNCCKWIGVHCSEQTGHVLRIDLKTVDNCYSVQGNEAALHRRSCLGGTLSPSLINLTYLNYLDLSNNNFQGTLIPEFIGSLKNLSYLDLSRAFFRGKVPPSLGNLTNLQYLNLTAFAFIEQWVLDLPGISNSTVYPLLQNLWASDLNWLSGLSSLKYLALDNINLNKASSNWLEVVNMLPSLLELQLSCCKLDSIPHSLAFVNLTSLSILDLSYNDFQGTPIPQYIGSLKNLRYLDLSGAYFTGMVPPSVGNLSNLQYLDLMTYSFTREPWVLDLSCISGLFSLQYLRLDGMNLGMASNWLQAVNTLPSLIVLKLSDRKLIDVPYSLLFINFTSLSILDLSENEFNSLIPSWLFQISSLVTVQLQWSKLSGSIPNVPRVNLCNLHTLDLSHNNISGDTEEFIVALSKCNNSTLTNLYLSSNKLSGNLPDSIGYFKYLENLQLSRNSFSGPVPTSIGNLSLLKTLDLSFNKMNGTISENIGQLTKLYEMNLHENSWEGVITEKHLQNLTMLYHLSLSSTTESNSLVFNVRHNWIAPFSLNTLSICNCKLGPTFVSWLRTQVHVEELILSKVGISDSIRHWFSKVLPLKLRFLDLSHNQLRGKLPNTINVDQDAIVNLGFNRLDGSLSLWSNVTMLSMRNNFLTGPIPSNIGREMSRLNMLDLSRNFLNGSIPSSVSEMRNLFFLDLSNNYLTGEIPSNWQGLRQLMILDLSKNKLTGGIPSSTCSLDSLKWLKLNGNNLMGDLSMSLRDCAHLLLLDLGENRFFGTITIAENLFFLRYLRLRANMINGSIPEQLCRFPNLHVLDLAHNNLSGPIPRCFGNLNALKYKVTLLTLPPLIQQIPASPYVELFLKGRTYEFTKMISILNLMDFSRNNLTGMIPNEITNLTFLGTLNLSRNQLTGNIPDDIGRLQQLEALDFSCNNLSGPLPLSMSSVTFLSHLNMSHNNLSGPIPSTNQFQTFNDLSIYKGNPYLCGPPLTNDCSSGQGDVEDKGEVQDEDEFEKLWFFVCVGLGFIVGFWTVCGSLVIKRSWRHVYFRFVDEMKDKLLVIIAINMARLRGKADGE